MVLRRLTAADISAVWRGAVTLASLAALWACLAVEGRRLWCACRSPIAFVADAASSHTSQHLLDPYSFSHVQHGLLLALAWRGLRGRAPWLTATRAFALTALIETGWEVFENSPLVIDRYRTATAALGYEGDSAVDSSGDLLCCLAGFLLAERLSARRTWLLFAAIELVMLATIRDNLILNVLMLVAPIEAVKAWQLRGW